jgi:alcohol oxidase
MSCILSRYIDQKTGTRSDAAHHYIYDQEYNKNIHILEEARVKRVIFEGTKAVGIEWVKERIPGSSAAADEKVHVVRSSKLVVLSAGALGSPAILERSGIGGEKVLKRHNIERLVDLPGVGENYMDHSGMLLLIEAADEAECLDDLFNGKAKLPMDEMVAQWQKDGSTLLAHNGIDVGIKFRPNAKELELLGPQFRERWETFFAPAPDKPVMWMGVVATSYGVQRTAENANRQYYTMDYFNEHPASRGYAHISSPDPHAALDFHPGFLDDPVDTAVLRFGYKKAREWARRMPIYRGEYAPGHPAFSETSNARIVHRDGPYSITEPDIEYSAEDDALIDEFTKRTVQTNWHSLGTCGMKPRDKGGVVDPYLNVYGVEGLKVADGSICPSNVAANTNNTVLIIGEKAAIIIASELGINL